MKKLEKKTNMSGPKSKRCRVIFVRELIEVLALQTHAYVQKKKRKKFVRKKERGKEKHIRCD